MHELCRKRKHLETDCWERIEEKQKRTQETYQGQMNVIQVMEKGNGERKSNGLVSATRCGRDCKALSEQCHVEGKDGGIKRSMNINDLFNKGPLILKLNMVS